MQLWERESNGIPCSQIGLSLRRPSTPSNRKSILKKRCRYREILWCSSYRANLASRSSRSRCDGVGERKLPGEMPDAMDAMSNFFSLVKVQFSCGVDQGVYHDTCPSIGGFLSSSGGTFSTLRVGYGARQSRQKVGLRMGAQLFFRSHARMRRQFCLPAFEYRPARKW